ncbi:MAG TPA: nicotinamide-nucleotide amidohydrolase family protein, partial [Oculatellaceae cyanobacterium]
APYVGQGEIRIRISAKAESDEKAAVLIEPVKHQILERAGKYYLGEGEMPIEARLAEILARKALSLSIAESCTGGLISSRITDVPGSSAFTFINMVTYGNTEKSRFIEVSPETLRLHGAVSPEVAGEMARGIRNQSHCDIGLSITGIAGPKGGSPEKPVGLAYVGICGSGTPCNKEAATDSSAPDLLVKKIVVNPQLPRREIKLLFSQYALFFLLKHLSGELESDFPALSMTR